MTQDSCKHRRIVLRTVFTFWLILLPALAHAEALRFAIVSDSHVGAANSVYPAFIRAMDEARIEMIIHVGDAINIPGKNREWLSFLETTGPARQLHLAPGNHDIRGAASLTVFRRHFPKPYYSFPEGDTLFVLLNTQLPGEEAMVTGEQFAWLQAELARPFRHKFVFAHQPLFPVVLLHGLDRHPAERDRLHALFVRSDVSLVVSGHDHIYDRTSRDGITYVIAGATGGVQPVFLRNADSFRYMVVTRNAEGYSFLVKDMAGNTRDEFVVGGTANRRVPVN